MTGHNILSRLICGLMVQCILTGCLMQKVAEKYRINQTLNVLLLYLVHIINLSWFSTWFL